MAAKKHAKRAAALAGKGIMAIAKHRAPAGAWGAGAYYLEQFAADHSDFVASKWYGGPLAIFGASCAFVKSPQAGHALAGYAGGKAAFNKQLADFQNGKREHSPVPDFTEKEEDKKSGGNTGLVQEKDAGLEQGAGIYN